MKRLLIALTILALLTVAGHPTLAGNNNMELGIWNLERSHGVGHETLRAEPQGEAWNVEHTAGDNVWSQCSQGMGGSNVMALALSPDYANDYTLFAGTRDGVFKSTDGGDSWSAVNTGLTNLIVLSLALSPGYATDHSLFAGIYGGGVCKSTDGGASWSTVNTDLTSLYVFALALSPGYVTDLTLFAGTWNGVFKSTNGGASWSVTGLPSVWVSALVLSPSYATDHTIFAGNRSWYSGGHVVYGGVCKSSDGGDSWSDVNTGLTNRNVYALALSPGYATDHTIFTGTEGGGVFRSSDGGDSWNAVNMGLANLSVQALVLSPGDTNDHTLFAGTWGGVFKSTDGGAFWMAMNEGLGNLFIPSLALTPTSPRTIFAGTVGSSIWQYTLLRPYQLWLLRVLKGYGM